jgi:hypothetical protein
VFADPVYDNLDDITKMIEPHVDVISETIGMLPDEFEITSSDLETMIKNNTSWGNIFLYQEEIVKYKINQMKLEISPCLLADAMRGHTLYKIEMDASTSFDLDSKQLTGVIKLIKQKTHRTEEEINSGFLESIRRMGWEVNKPDFKPRLNEIADIFDLKEARKQLKTRYKVDGIVKGLQEQIKDRRLNIKDVELQNRFVKWITAYVKQGSLPAMANLCKMKIMLMDGSPIYSMEKEEVI